MDEYEDEQMYHSDMEVTEKKKYNICPIIMSENII